MTDVTLDAGAIRVEIPASLDSKTLPTIAGLAWLLPEASVWLAIVSEPDGVLEGPLAAFREFSQATDEWQQEFRLWRTLTTWRWNNNPVAEPEILRCWVASLAVHTRDEQPAAAIRGLQDLRTLAEEVEDWQLVTLIKDVVSFHRHRLMNLPMEERQIERMMEQIKEWSPRPRDWPRLLPGQ